MFLKAFLIFSCLVLFTTSRPTLSPRNCIADTERMNILSSDLNKINCSSLRVPDINFTEPHELEKTYQSKFCLISKVLKNSSCTDFKIKELQELSDRMKGNATCKLLDNVGLTTMKNFLNNINKYSHSLHMCCQK